MKMMTLIPVNRPAKFADVKFTQDDWNSANRAGPKRVPAITAIAALRNGKGVYQIKPEATDAVAVAIQALKDPAEMTAPELVAEMTTHGKPPRKQMSRAKAVDFVRDLREIAVALITEDEDEK